MYKKLVRVCDVVGVVGLERRQRADGKRLPCVDVVRRRGVEKVRDAPGHGRRRRRQCQGFQTPPVRKVLSDT